MSTVFLEEQRAYDPDNKDFHFIDSVLQYCLAYK